jgi:hypothetical protein
MDGDTIELTYTVRDPLKTSKNVQSSDHSAKIEGQDDLDVQEWWDGDVQTMDTDIDVRSDDRDHTDGSRTRLRDTAHNEAAMRDHEGVDTHTEEREAHLSHISRTQQQHETPQNNKAMRDDPDPDTTHMSPGQQQHKATHKNEVMRDDHDSDTAHTTPGGTQEPHAQSPGGVSSAHEPGTTHMTHTHKEGTQESQAQSPSGVSLLPADVTRNDNVRITVTVGDGELPAGLDLALTRVKHGGRCIVTVFEKLGSGERGEIKVYDVRQHALLQAMFDVRWKDKVELAMVRKEQGNDYFNKGEVIYVCVYIHVFTYICTYICIYIYIYIYI